MHASVRTIAGHIQFHIVGTHDRSQFKHTVWLISAKNLFARQLPRMGKDYIARLVLDHRHRTLVLVKRDKAVGAITYRPFEQVFFAEIVFCAIASSEQVKGYGTLLMQRLKDHLVRHTAIRRCVTYADNFAIGYFQKQGFTKELSVPRCACAGRRGPPVRAAIP